MTVIMQETIELACTPSMIPQEDREAHLTNSQQLILQTYLELKELADGYAFKFSADKFETLTRFIGLERLCCSFFTFELKIAPNQGSIWIHLRGSEQIKAFIKMELQANNNQDVD